MLIATLVKKYNQSTGVVNSIINLLHQFEHLPSVIAEMTEVITKEYQFQIVPDILR